MTKYSQISVIFLFLATSTIFIFGSVNKDRPYNSVKSSEAMKVGIVLQPYTGHRRGTELSPGPEIVYPELMKELASMGVEQGSKSVVKLTPEEEKDYGIWHRVGLANGHLGRTIASLVKKGEFPLGLLGNCTSLMGMLAGFQHSGPTRRPLEVGLIWIDAHGDFNTPETTLSGMLGGMPVACAAGKCLFRLRFKAGLDPAIPTSHIIMMGVRDLDPLEAELIDNSNITMVTTEDMIERNQKMRDALDRLSEEVDVIYVHIDLDVLDASEIPGANFLVPNGPTGTQLGEALKLMLSYEKVGGLGIASFPTMEEGRAKSMQSTLQTIRGGLEGLKSR